MSYNFTHFTRFSIAGLSLFTVLAGGVATQALAPDNLKPTQVVQSIKDKYFGVNKQSDPDPQVALVGDGENYLAYLEGCDLGIKFPKIIDGKEASTSFFDANSDSSYLFGPKYDHSMKGSVYEDEFGYNIICSQLDDKYKIPGYDPLGILGQNTARSNIDVSQFKKETGWFASNENTISTIIKFDRKATDLDLGDAKNGYSFDYNGKKIIVLLNKELSKTSLKFTDFQLQFGSQLAQSVKSNKELFASNLPTTKDTNCDNLLSLSYNKDKVKEVRKENSTTGGIFDINNFVYTNRVLVKNDNDTQIIIHCNEGYLDTIKQADEYLYKVNLVDLPDIFTTNFKLNINIDKIYGQKTKFELGYLEKGDSTFILQDKKGNNLRFIVFNYSTLSNELKLQIDLK